MGAEAGHARKRAPLKTRLKELHLEPGRLLPPAQRQGKRLPVVDAIDKNVSVSSVHSPDSPHADAGAVGADRGLAGGRAAGHDG